MWQGLQIITGYKPKPAATPNCNDKTTTPDRLNEFYARFDLQNKDPVTVLRPSSASSLPPPFTVQQHEVASFFRKQKCRKAAGPDGVLTATLKNCADQLAPVFTDIFNDSLSKQSVPNCFKSATIIPVPKKSIVTSLNDYRPVALTSVVMKVFERLILRYIKECTVGIMDSSQFAYRENRCVEDAVALTLHSILQHLEMSQTYARILFIDYSSAFNTIIPQKLFVKLCAMDIDLSMCHWILDFLLNRQQVVKFNGNFSDVMLLNTGAPQGCVLSPLLYSLFTNDCVSHHESVKITKFADDTTLAGLIKCEDESAYHNEVSNLVKWCGENNLLLNASKTKEVIVDFRQKKKSPIRPLYINGEIIETVDSFKFLGTIISNDLKWEQNVDKLVKKANQRLFFLRQLRRFGVKKEILMQFYRSVVESILTFSIVVWYGNTTEKQKTSLNRVVKSAAKIVGETLPTLSSLYLQRVNSRAQKIIKDSSHPANNLFQLLRSKRRFRYFKTKTERFKNSFYPKAMTIAKVL